MTQYGPGSSFIVVGGRNLSADHFMLSEDVENVYEQTNGLGTIWEEHKPIGLGRVMLEASGGLYEDATLHNVEAFQGSTPTFQGQGQVLQLVTYGMNGTAAGADVVMINGTYAATWKRMASREGLTKANAIHKMTGTYYRGKLLHGFVSETTASGNTEGPSVDNTVLTSNGAIADLHVPQLALGGYTNVTIKVRHSVDDITYADLLTFAVVTLPGTAQRVQVAGTVNRHLAISWLFNGAGAAQSIQPYVAVTRL